MLRSGKVFLLLLLAVVLVGCNQKVEVRTDDAFVSAKKVFEMNNKNTNNTVGDIEFYKPPMMKIDEESNSQHIVLTKRKDSFYLTVNPNEKKTSHVYYDVLLTDEPNNLVGAKTFSKDEAFGFVAVTDKGEKQVELIASVGGTKIETVTNEENTEAYLEKMMEIARSVQHVEK